jgi:hypothetical protein
LEKDDQYFADHEAQLLKMDEDALAFFVQEVAANVADAGKKTSKASKEKITIPALTGNEDAEKPSLSEIAEYLREQRNKKKISEDN